MTVEHFFRMVWRFNALAFALACTLALILSAYALVQVLRHETRSVSAHSVTRLETSTSLPETFEIGTFTWLDENRTVWAPVLAEQNYRLGHSAKTAGSTRNYLVYDMATARTTRLLPDNLTTILSAHPLRLDRPATSEPAPSPKAILLTLLPADTNGDGLVTPRDDIAIALARPEGTGLKRLPIAARRLLFSRLQSDASLFLVVGHEKMAEAITISIPGFEITRRVQIDTGLPTARSASR